MPNSGWRRPPAAFVWPPADGRLHRSVWCPDSAARLGSARTRRFRVRRRDPIVAGVQPPVGRHPAPIQGDSGTPRRSRVLPSGMRVELLRKVASICRERAELDKRLANIISATPDPDGLAAWVAAEVLGLQATGDLFSWPPGGAWPAGSVEIAWSNSASADARPERADHLLLFVSGGSSPVIAGSRIERSCIESLWLIGRTGRAERVYPAPDIPPIELDPAQTAALALFDCRTKPALTRYH